MNLAEHQRTLLGLIRSTYEVSTSDDHYFQGVAESKNLEEARRNIFLWRIYVLERTAPLTVTLLRQRGLLDETVRNFIRRENISPFRETQAPAFLASLGAHPDHVVASTAQFEHALLKVKQGDTAPYIVHWRTDPVPVLHALASRRPVEASPGGSVHVVRISGELRALFEITPGGPE